MSEKYYQIDVNKNKNTFFKSLKKSVLIVDDSLIMRKMLKEILIESEYFQCVGEANNGADAVVKYRELLPDVMTMDITMPEMDGMEALRHIKNINPRAKVVLISAMSHENNLVKAKKLGVSYFLIKPFNPEKVINVLKKVCGII